MAGLQKVIQRLEKIGDAAKRAKTEFEKAHQVAQRNAALPVEQGGLGLPPDNTAMDRAKAMGFDVMQRMAHGTDKDFKSFKIGKSGVNELGEGVYAAPINKSAYGYNYSDAWAGTGEGARAIPLLVKQDIADLDAIKTALRNPAEYGIRDAEKEIIERIVQGDKGWQGEDELLRETLRKIGAVNSAKKAGYAGVRSEDSQVPGQVLTFDTKNIRSPFAAFDPMKRNSSNILAGAGAGVAAMAGSRQPSEEEHRQSAIDKMVRQMAYGEGWQ